MVEKDDFCGDGSQYWPVAIQEHDPRADLTFFLCKIIMVDHLRRKALIQRLVEAENWKDEQGMSTRIQKESNELEKLDKVSTQTQFF